LLKEIECICFGIKKEMLLNGYRTEYIFTTKAGNFYDRHNVLTVFNSYHKKIGIPEKGIHVYRHTFGTKLCEEGYPIQVASKLLGHSSIGVTAKYYINIDDNRKRVQ
jgi:site-specific recombinase XerD